MKTTIIQSALVLALLATAGAISLAAGKQNSFSSKGIYPTSIVDESTGEKNQVTLYTWLQQHMHCPDFVNDNGSHRVEVWLHIDEANTIHIIRTKSDSSKLCDYVENELNGTLFPFSDKSMSYHFAIQFKRIA